MNEIIAGHFARLALGQAQTYRDIVVFPLLGPDAGPAPYLTLGEALSSQWLTVTGCTWICSGFRGKGRVGSPSESGVPGTSGIPDWDKSKDRNGRTLAVR